MFSMSFPYIGLKSALHQFLRVSYLEPRILSTSRQQATVSLPKLELTAASDNHQTPHAGSNPRVCRTADQKPVPPPTIPRAADESMSRLRVTPPRRREFHCLRHAHVAPARDTLKAAPTPPSGWEHIAPARDTPASCLTTRSNSSRASTIGVAAAPLMQTTDIRFQVSIMYFTAPTSA